MPAVSRVSVVHWPFAPERCFEAFIDVAMLPTWLPWLRRARVVTRDAQGRPSEVSFELGSKLSYTLSYRYDDQRGVAWEPRAGRKDAVRGQATFEPEGDGCRMTYTVEPAQASRDRPEEDAARIVAAFAAWLRRARRSEATE